MGAKSIDARNCPFIAPFDIACEVPGFCACSSRFCAATRAVGRCRVKLAAEVPIVSVGDIRSLDLMLSFIGGDKGACTVVKCFVFCDNCLQISVWNLLSCRSI